MPFLAFFVSRGLSRRAATVAAWAVTIGLAGLILAAIVLAIVRWLGNREKAAIETYETGVSYEAAVRAAQAERDANTNYTAAKVEQAREEAELRHEASKGDDRGVGPGVAGVLDRLRREEGHAPAADTSRR